MTVGVLEGLRIGPLVDGPHRAGVERDEHRDAAVLVGLVVAADDHAVHVVGDIDRLRAGERLPGVGVQQVAPAETAAVEYAEAAVTNA